MNRELKNLLFEQRPAPVLPEHRPLYKIGQILLILQMASRGGKSSLPRIQLLNWGMKSRPRQLRLIDAGKKERLNVSAWGFDPAVAIALNYAVQEDLIHTSSTGYKISEAGEKFVSAFCGDADNFASERDFLKALGKSITEAMVVQVAKVWEEQ